MRKRRLAVLLGLLAIMAIMVAGCGKEGTFSDQGPAIFETRGQVAGFEGLFQRGDTAAQIEQKANDNGLEFRKLEVERFRGGTLNTIEVVDEPNQPLFAFAFLPTGETSADGLMVIVNRDTDFTEAVLGFNCDGMKFYLGRGGVSGFTNEFCS